MRRIVLGLCLLTCLSCTGNSDGNDTGPVSYYNGSHPTCDSDADCPQYHSCGRYVGVCTQSVSGQWVVGDCSCGDSEQFGGPCYCVGCSLEEGAEAEVDTGLKLCFREDKYCNNDNDCGEPGLRCKDKWHECLPSGEGHRPCQTDEDCLFGWECVDNPPDLMAVSCSPYGDVISEDSDAVSEGSADETNPCCSPRVCTPHGWLGPTQGCT